MFKTDVAAQLFGGHANALFEFACQMATAQTKVARKLFNGDAAFTDFYGLDGFLSDDVVATIGFKAVDQIRIDGVDARLGGLAVILNMSDKFASPSSPEIIHIRILVDQLMRRIFKKWVAAAGLKTNPEQMDGTG